MLRQSCRKSILVVAAVAAASAAAADEYLVIAGGATSDPTALPRGVERAVAAAGGVVVNAFPEIGVLVVDSDNENFAESVAGGVTVIRNLRVRLPEGLETGPISQNVEIPPFTGDDDVFFDLQWPVASVRSQEAWAAGVTGKGVRVFVLDEGFDMDHPDLAPNLNVALSTSFVQNPFIDESAPDYLLADTFSHGTHVAGTIAAADNAFGVIGVAPEAELVFVKVLSEIFGYGEFSWILDGILYAADNGADVINMSLGAIFAQGLGPDAAEAAALRVAVNRAITYAARKGATVIVSAGNDGLDLNSAETASFINFNGFASHAISISAVAPVGWALDADMYEGPDLYRASYTNYGSQVDFAGQGGDAVYTGNETCTIAGLTRPCWVFDLVFSTGNGGWYWSAGTSMAAPHAAGVAALIISENGGDMTPAHVKREMQRRATDMQTIDSKTIGYGLVGSGY